MSMIYRTALGQDSHRFPDSNETRPLRIAGIDIATAPKLEANSDGDVVLHAVTNAISGITSKNVIGARADVLCQAGITDSRAYLELALVSSTSRSRSRRFDRSSVRISSGCAVRWQSFSVWSPGRSVLRRRRVRGSPAKAEERVSRSSAS